MQKTKLIFPEQPIRLKKKKPKEMCYSVSKKQIKNVNFFFINNQKHTKKPKNHRQIYYYMTPLNFHSKIISVLADWKFITIKQLSVNKSTRVMKKQMVIGH